MTLQPPRSANEWADYYYYDVGENVIPAISKIKKPLVPWKEDPRGNWEKIAIPEEIFNEWKNENKFKDGMAVICGEVYRGEHKGKWLNGIDCDNKLAIKEMCPSGINNIASITVIEQHANKDKCHIYFYTSEPIQSKAPLDGDNIPKIEIKSGGKFLLYCAGGIHKDGSPIEILGSRKIKTVDKFYLETRIDDIFKKYGLTYLETTSTQYQKPLYQVEGKLHEGNNRGVHILSYIESKKIKNQELNENDLFYLAKKYQDEKCIDKYDDDKIKDLVRQGTEFAEKKIQERSEQVIQNLKLIDKKKNTSLKKEDAGKIIDNFIEKYDIVTPFNTDDIFYRDGVIHRLGIDGILLEEIKELMLSEPEFNYLKFNIRRKSQVPKDEPNPFDNDWIGLTNIILDPKTFEAITEKEYVNKVLNRKYRPKLIDREDRILEAIKQILGDHYKKFLAICVVLLTGKNDIKKFIIFDGPPDSAKTTLLEILMAFVVAYTSQKLQNLQKDTKRLAKCTSILNVSDEAENCILDEDIFKGIIDGALQQEAWKYEKELTTYDPNKVLHVGGANGIPDIRDNSGVAKRIERIPCENHFEKNEEWKKNLLIEDNLDRFLLTVIEYAKLGEKNPLLEMSNGEKTILFEKMGDPIGYFKENYMFEDPGKDCGCSDVREVFDTFCKDNGINREYSPQKFGRELGIKSEMKRDGKDSFKVYKNWSLVGKSYTNSTL